MALKRKMTDYENEMERLRMLLDTVETSDEEIDCASDNEIDFQIYSSHDSDSEFEADNKSFESDQENDIYEGKNKTVWRKVKPNSKVRTSSCNIIVHLPGLKSVASGIKKPIESWELFFDCNVIKNIVDYTNIFIDRISANFQRSRDARNTDEVEMRALFGLLYLCGLHKSSHANAKDLWEADGTGIELFRKTMSYKRFTFLLRCMRLDNTNDREARRQLDKLAAVRDFFSKFNEKCQNVYSVSEYVTIDEKLEKFRGRCAFRQYMPKKPAKYGIKLFALVDARTYYTYNMEIYAGQQPEGSFKVENSPSAIVKRLCTPLFGSGRNVTMDNWYTSYPLAKELLSKRLTVVGTLKKNKAVIPVEFLETKKREVFSSMFGFQKDITLVSYVPKKSKCVVLLSTMHHDNAINKNSDQKKPEIIEFYNATKGGVDTVDEMSTLYSTARKTNRWPMVIFYCVLNVAAINARVALMSTKNAPLQYKTRRMFLKTLAVSLVNPQIRNRSSMWMLPKELREKINHDFSSAESNGVSEGNVTKKVKFGKGRCAICPRGKDRKTTISCTKCEHFTCKDHSNYVCDKCL